MAFASDQQRKWFFANNGGGQSEGQGLEFDTSKLEGFDVSKYREAFESWSGAPVTPRVLRNVATAFMLEHGVEGRLRAEMAQAVEGEIRAYRANGLPKDFNLSAFEAGLHEIKEAGKVARYKPG